MSDDGLEAVLADALHAQIDGDFLVAASRWEKGADVALSTASATEVVWWAVNAVAPAVRAHIAGTLDAVNDERLRLAIENAGLRDDLARLTPTDGARPRRYMHGTYGETPTDGAP